MKRTFVRVPFALCFACGSLAAVPRALADAWMFTGTGSSRTCECAMAMGGTAPL